MPDYRLVPAEPTEEMVRAGDDSGDWGPPGYDDHPNGAAGPESCYRAMLAAAPDAAQDAVWVEAVARVLWDSDGPVYAGSHVAAPKWEWPNIGDDAQNYWRRKARAVLALVGGAGDADH